MSSGVVSSLNWPSFVSSSIRWSIERVRRLGQYQYHQHAFFTFGTQRVWNFISVFFSWIIWRWILSLSLEVQFLLSHYLKSIETSRIYDCTYTSKEWHRRCVLTSYVLFLLGSRALQNQKQRTPEPLPPPPRNILRDWLLDYRFQSNHALVGRWVLHLRMCVALYVHLNSSEITCLCLYV